MIGNVTLSFQLGLRRLIYLGIAFCSVQTRPLREEKFLIHKSSAGMDKDGNNRAIKISNLTAPDLDGNQPPSATVP
jgi:hypothetical protein